MFLDAKVEAELQELDDESALELLESANPLPDVTGRVTTSASCPASTRRWMARKMRPWTGSAKCSGARNSETCS